MDTGVKLTLPKAWAFSENTVTKNEETLSEKPNFGSKLGGIGWECYFWSLVSALKAGICKKSSKMAKMICRIGGSLGESDGRALISPKNVGSWATAETISKNMRSLGDSSAENRWSLEPYIRVTSIMGVPPGAYWQYENFPVVMVIPMTAGSPLLLNGS